MNILIIDDSKTVRKSLAAILKTTHHKLYEAETGIEGFGAAFEIRPDIIFIDVMMPRFDGLQLCELLKKQQWAKKIMICMLTGKETLLDKAKIKNSGANHLILKPFDTQNLLNFLKSVEEKTFNKSINIFE